jgi:excisionase family DNA binding protein
MTTPLVLISPEELQVLVSNAVQTATQPIEQKLETIQRILADKEDDALTTAKVAELLRCDEQTVIRYHKEEGLEGVRRGRGYLFRRSHVMNFLTSSNGAKLAEKLRGMAVNRGSA